MHFHQKGIIHVALTQDLSIYISTYALAPTGVKTSGPHKCLGERSNKKKGAGRRCAL